MNPPLKMMGLAGRRGAQMPRVIAVSPEPIGKFVAGMQLGRPSIGDAEIQLGRGRTRHLNRIYAPGNEQGTGGDGHCDHERIAKDPRQT